MQNAIKCKSIQIMNGIICKISIMLKLFFKEYGDEVEKPNY